MKPPATSPIPHLRETGARMAPGNRWTWARWRRGMTWALLPLMVSCRALPPLPSSDLGAPGWAIRHGQAVWHPPGDELELAGDLLVAAHASGHCFVQLTKEPFPLVTARVAHGVWEIRHGAEGRVRRGRGTPPSQVIWFQLPQALQSGKVPAPWKWETPNPGRWRLEHPRSRETLEGVLFP